jgi:hypothetical protein
LTNEEGHDVLDLQMVLSQETYKGEWEALPYYA